MALMLALGPGLAAAQVMPRPAAQSEVCAADDDDDEDDSKPVPLWKRFAWEGACIELSGSLDASYQKQKASAGRLPILTTRQGVVSNASELATGDVNFRIDTTRKTALGDLKTGFEVQYQKTSADSGAGLLTLTEGIVTWAGIRAGYTDSQVNYWSGDFQFSATAPQRTVGLAAYEFKLGEDWTFTLAYETGLPTTQASSSKFATAYPEDPVASAKLYFEKDDASFQLAGLLRELRINGSHPLLAFLNRQQEYRELGWVLTAGATLPVKLGGEGSEFSMQATYAVNASPYLGTAADASSLAGTIPVPVTSEGWSVVGSYHHVWSDHWESNVMASRLGLDVTAPRLAPSIRTTRYAANLIWKPIDDLKLGAEAGRVESEIDPGGSRGLFRGLTGKGVAGYLFVSWSF